MSVDHNPCNASTGMPFCKLKVVQLYAQSDMADRRAAQGVLPNCYPTMASGFGAQLDDFRLLHFRSYRLDLYRRSYLAGSEI